MVMRIAFVLLPALATLGACTYAPDQYDADYRQAFLDTCVRCAPRVPGGEDPDALSDCVTRLPPPTATPSRLERCEFDASLASELVSELRNAPCGTFRSETRHLPARPYECPLELLPLP